MSNPVLQVSQRLEPPQPNGTQTGPTTVRHAATLTVCCSTAPKLHVRQQATAPQSVQRPPAASQPASHHAAVLHHCHCRAVGGHGQAVMCLFSGSARLAKQSTKWAAGPVYVVVVAAAKCKRLSPSGAAIAWSSTLLTAAVTAKHNGIAEHTTQSAKRGQGIVILYRPIHHCQSIAPSYCTRAIATVLSLPTAFTA